MRNAGLDETQVGVNIARRNINNLRYADDTTLMEESEEELKSLLKKVGKATRPFRYELNQNFYNYTVEVTNRFKGLDLIDRVPDELCNEVHNMNRRQGSRPSPWKRNAKKQNGCLGRPY